MADNVGMLHGGPCDAKKLWRTGRTKLRETIGMIGSDRGRVAVRVAGRPNHRPLRPWGSLLFAHSVLASHRNDTDRLTVLPYLVGA